MQENSRVVLCFSPTGGCRTIAESLIRQNDAFVDFTSPEKRKDTPSFDRLSEAVFVIPVYNRSVPDVCAQYIKKLSGKKACASVICVYGGVTKGKSLQKTAKLLKDSNFTLKKGAYVAAPHFYSDKKLNALSDERLQRIRAFVDGEFNGRLMPTPSKSSPPSASVRIQPFLKAVTGKCITDIGKCTACGLCLKVCPVAAINGDFNADKNCILCGACVKACPSHAREIRFFTPVPPLFVNLNCKHRDDEFFEFADKCSTLFPDGLNH